MENDIKKYLGCELTENEKQALKMLDDENKEYIKDLIILGKINYYVPKILNYFEIEIKKDKFIFASSVNRIALHKSEVEKQEKETANVLKYLTGVYIRDFNKEACEILKELLQNVIELNKIDVKLLDDSVMISYVDFLDLLERLKLPVFINIEE